MTAAPTTAPASPTAFRTGPICPACTMSHVKGPCTCAEAEARYVAALRSPAFHHVGFRRMSEAGQTYAIVYHRDPTSPTGVFSAENTPHLTVAEATPILRGARPDAYTVDGPSHRSGR